MLTVSRDAGGGVPHSRPSPLLDPTRRPAGCVAVTCTAHGAFVAWCSPPAPSCTVGCPPSCATPDPGDLPPAGSPAPFPIGVDGSGSTVGAADPAGTRSAVDAGSAAPSSGTDRGAPPAAEDAPAPLDPDDVRRCPLGPACESCGAVDDLTLITGEAIPGAVACLTACSSCADADNLPRWPVSTAVARTAEHAEHLGTDLDALGAAVRRLRNPGGAR